MIIGSDVVKRILMLFGILMVLMTVPAFAADANVTLDGEDTGLTVCVAESGTSYVSFRAFCETIGDMTVTMEDETVTAVAPDGSWFIQGTLGDPYLVANGRYLYTGDSVVCLWGNTTMIPVRTLAKAFDLDVAWNGETGTVELTSGQGVVVHGDEFYSPDDVYWLARIINAESGNQPLRGKVAVGSVILNRVESPIFPDNVYDVIFDCRYSVQFTPVSSGSIHSTPNVESVIAAKLCLDGAREAEDSLYFVASQAAGRSWAGRNRPYCETIGNHNFYL